MLVTGIIKEINISGGSSKNNKYKVEINLFKIPGDYNPDSCIYEANCAVPGNYGNLYNVGDKVYIGFINGDKSLPVIMGKIYQGVSEEARGYANIDTLKIKSSAELPKDIKIGEYSYEDIDKYFTQVNLIQEKIDSDKFSSTDSIVNMDFGGITKGTNLKGKSSIEILRMLLSPYISPELLGNGDEAD